MRVKDSVDTNEFSFEGLVSLDGVDGAEVCGPDGCTPAPGTNPDDAPGVAAGVESPDEQADDAGVESGEAGGAN